MRLLGSSDLIADVLDLEVLAGGSIWILNSTEPLFIAFDSEGNVTQAHGRLGGGPQEFGNPAGFANVGTADEAWVFDSERHLLIEVSSVDRPRREIPLPEEEIPRGTVAGANPFLPLLSLRRAGNELIVPRRWEGAGTSMLEYWVSSWASDLVTLDLSNITTRTVVSLRDVFDDPMARSELPDTPLPFPFWYRLWDVCGGEIRVYDRGGNQIRGFAMDGVETDPIPLPPVLLEGMSARDFAQATFDLTVVERMGEVPRGTIHVTAADSARVLRNVMPRLNATPDELASLLPRYVDLHCDETGVLWIQAFDPSSPGPMITGLRGSRRWLRIAPDVEILEVRLPDDFDVLRVRADRIWGILRDELDVASVAWIEMPRLD